LINWPRPFIRLNRKPLVWPQPVGWFYGKSGTTPGKNTQKDFRLKEYIL
jgi:hypothetical protein